MNLSESKMPLVENEDLNKSDFGYDNEGCSSGYESATEQSSADTDRESDTSISEFNNDELPAAEPEVMKYRSTQELCNTLQCIISLPDLCDVMFLVGEKRVPIYGMKAILATRSRVFYNLILDAQRQLPSSKKSKKKSKENSTPSNHIVIEIRNYQPDDFRELITFVHCGKVNINTSNVTGLYCGASEFDLTDLKIACRDFTTRTIRKGNASAILKSTKFYLAHHRAAAKFIEKIHGYQRSING
ncbi:serine-enriched protein-like [Saccostrea echinata]|uniref:serine-enriched protein-like n=1 Tax=Saccostrea echinata TaxID=191078 RepID=UPI002A7FEE5A|nr:serine-enriched protein-like [Saccostrea echinata]